MERDTARRPLIVCSVYDYKYPDLHLFNCWMAGIPNVGDTISVEGDPLEATVVTHCGAHRFCVREIIHYVGVVSTVDHNDFSRPPPWEHEPSIWVMVDPIRDES